MLRIADGQQDAARRAQRRPAPGGAPQPDRLRRPGRSSSRRLVCCRKVAPLFYDLPAPEAPTGAAPPILAAMTTRARRRRASRLWRPDLQLVEVNGARRGALPRQQN